MDRTGTIERLSGFFAEPPAAAADVAAAWLFGSFARGDARADSDVDVAVLSRHTPAATFEALPLRLIQVEELALEVFAPGEAFGNTKRRVQGRFVHTGQKYAFWVTDPRYERRYPAKLDGSYRIGECHLTISLGEPYKDSFYKLIAAIIEPDRR